MEPVIVGYGKTFNCRWSREGELRTNKSLLTFKYDDVSEAHITEDNHCYILWIWHSGDIYSPTHYIFPEAIKIFKTLPDTYSKKFSELVKKGEK